MVNMPPGFTHYRPWNYRAPRQLFMPRPSIPMVNYNYTSTCGCNGSGMSKAGWWALGIGGVIGLLPQVLQWCGVGGGGATTTTTTTTTTNANQDKTLTNLNSQFSDYNWVHEDGMFIGVHKEDPSKQIKGATYTEIASQFQKTTKPTQNANLATLNTLAQDKGLTVKQENGNYVVTTSAGVEVYNGTDINEALKKVSNYSTMPTVVTEKPVDEEGKIGDLTSEQVNEIKSKASEKGLSDVEITYDDTTSTYTVTYMENGTTKTATGTLDQIKQALGITEDASVDGENPVDDLAPVKTGGGFQFPELPTGFKWQRVSGDAYKDKEVSDIVSDLNKKYPNLNITAEQITKANPTAIKDGKVVDTSKLDLPTVKDTTPSKAFTAAEKAQKMVIRMVIDLNDAATVVTPDGKIYTTDKASSASTAATDLTNQLKEAGWTNVTIRNDNFGLNENATSATNFDKTRPYSIRMVIDKKANLATAMTPDGINHRASNNVDELLRVLKNAGWTNITLVTKDGKWSTVAADGSQNGTAVVTGKGGQNRQQTATQSPQQSSQQTDIYYRGFGRTQWI